MRKKGEGLAMGTLITIIIAILGFLVLLGFFVYYQLNWSGRINEEVCHQSVIYRATAPTVGGINQYIPLKCQTQKFCITTGLIGGECEEFKNTEGVARVKVSSGVDGKRQIEKFMTQEMIDCWSMMGEGKVEVFGDWLADYAIKGIGSSCVVCSRIAFDKTSLDEAKVPYKEINVLTYMRTHKVPGKEYTYFDYLSSQNGKMSFNNLQQEAFPVVPIEEVYKDGKFVIPEQTDFRQATLPTSKDQEINELGIMFMQVSSPSGTDVLKNYLQAMELNAVGSFILAPRLTVLALKSPVTWIVLGVFAVYVGTTVVSNQAFAVGHCADLETKDGAKRGCSAVRIVDYGQEDLKQYCSIIESIP